MDQSDSLDLTQTAPSLFPQSLDSMVSGLSTAQSDPQVPKPAAAADPEQDAQNLDLRAYGLAAKAGDNEAMNELHQDISARQARMSARAAAPGGANSPTSDSSLQNFLAGTGRGMERLAKGAGNLVGLGRVFPQTMGDQALKDSDEVDKPLLNTTAGQLGNITGQVAATAPLGAVTGPLAKALLAARAGAGAGVGGGVLRAAVGAGRTGLAAGENALQSAAMADPDDQGSAAMEGAALGGALNRLGAVGGRLTRGLVQRSQAAQDLTDAANAAGKDLFIPISQGADDSGISRVAGSTYRSLFPYAMGVEGRLARQSDAAKETLRDVAAGNATPLATDAEGVTAKLATPTGETQQATAQNLKSLYDQQYSRMKRYTFDKPSDFRDQVIDRINSDMGDDVDSFTQNKIANLADSAMERFSSGDDSISGNNLLNARNWIYGAIKRGDVAPGTVEERALHSGIGTIDDLVDDKLGQFAAGANNAAATPEQQALSATAARDLQDYKNLSSAYKEFKPYQQAVDAASDARGNFDFRTLARNASPGTANEKLGQDAAEVLERTDSGSPNAASWHALRAIGGLGAGLGAAMYGHPVAAIAGQVVPNVLTTKVAQRLLYGDTAGQRALAMALRRNPQAVYSLGLGATTSVNTVSQ